MAEEEKAEEQLLAAVKRVVDMPWKKTREELLWKSLLWHCQALGLEIVKVEETDTPPLPDPSQPPAQENDHGQK